jgi:hypothetical protein
MDSVASVSVLCREREAKVCDLCGRSMDLVWDDFQVQRARSEVLFHMICDVTLY